MLNLLNESSETLVSMRIDNASSVNVAILKKWNAVCPLSRKHVIKFRTSAEI